MSGHAYTVHCCKKKALLEHNAVILFFIHTLAFDNDYLLLSMEKKRRLGFLTFLFFAQICPDHLPRPL